MDTGRFIEVVACSSLEFACEFRGRTPGLQRTVGKRDMVSGRTGGRGGVGTVTLVLGLALALLPGLAGRVRAAERPITVFAAASLTDAMGRVARLWVAQGHPMPALSFASSAVLAQQAAQGAPADLFVSADEKWMDWLAARGLVRPGTRGDLLGNTLVLVEKRGQPSVTIGPQLDLAGLLGPGGRLAVGDPRSVPAGIYAEAALRKLGLWASVADRLAPAENVRAALLLVERGEVRAGIVYGSDVRAAPGLSVAGTFPEGSHPPILYPAAALTAAPEATAFLRFLHAAPATAAFRDAGFQTRP